MTRNMFLVAAGGVMALSAAAPLNAALIADYQFGRTADSPAPVTNGQQVGSGDGTDARLFDSSGNGNTGMAGGTPIYVTGTGVGNGSGFQSGSFGNGFGHYYLANPGPGAPSLSINSNFSVFTRVKFNSITDFTSVSGRPAGNYFQFNRPDGTLDIVFGGSGGDFSQNPTNVTFAGGVQYGTVAPKLANGRFYDVGYSFSGTSQDGTPDTVKLYLDGTLLTTATFTATFGTGDIFHFGANGGNGQPADAVFDRVSFYNNVLSDAQFADLSRVPEPASLGLLGLGGLGLLARRRRTA